MRKGLPVVMMFILACNNHPVKDTGVAVATADTQVKEVYAGRSRDTVAQVKDTLPSLGEEFEGENLDTILNRTIAKYKQPYIIDSVFTMDGNTYQLHLKHFCLMDSGIKVPKYYTDIYKLDSFVTHNYATQVKLEKNGKTIQERMVYKKDFEDLLYPSLRTYGVLMDPSVACIHDTINLHYSVSIPLTDVGIGVTMAVDTSGTVRHTSRHY